MYNKVPQYLVAQLIYFIFALQKTFWDLGSGEGGEGRKKRGGGLDNSSIYLKWEYLVNIPVVDNRTYQIAKTEDHTLNCMVYENQMNSSFMTFIKKKGMQNGTSVFRNKQ